MIRARHRLDFSAPRISDLPADEAKSAMLARDEAARLAWWINREAQPLRRRFFNLLLPGASAARPPAASTPQIGAFEARADPADHLADAGKPIPTHHIASAGNMVGADG